MCGIHATISVAKHTELSENLRQLLINRGPDHLGVVERGISLPSVAPDLRITLNFTSTVLALRGDHVAKQPFQHGNSDSVFCWNGEAWKFDDKVVGGNDGEVIFARLAQCEHGPFAFVFCDPVGQCLYFGRDRLGRRSLLMREEPDGQLLSFSSVADTPASGWEEVQANGIYSIRFHPESSGEKPISLGHRISRHEWVESGGADLVLGVGSFNKELPQGAEKQLDSASPSVSLLHYHLREALKLRVLGIPEPPRPADHQSDVDTRVAVLFSGGLDCTILARMADELLPTTQGIDLINVAFQNPRVSVQKQGASKPGVVVTDDYERCPDRQTGRKSFAELKHACPSRFWRFIAVNVPYEEAMAHKALVVSLIYPHDTEMDLSIALALYFAGRGVGASYTESAEFDSDAPMVSTPARVLFSGLGADELFGGYSRHVRAFEREGYQALVNELELDIARIGQRNLGRDDRVLANWGKEVRFPYLDEGFVRFVMSSPVWEKCDFGNKAHPADIEPAKRALRLLADQLSLPVIARERKRAIQFGTRTAKLGSSTGSDDTSDTSELAEIAPGWLRSHCAGGYQDQARCDIAGKCAVRMDRIIMAQGEVVSWR
ncbi:Asparagine synthetase domain-containing protein [Apiospora phragmitis]|uniref:Asparagine synthetase domain-containing protein n=1 Tax=Apiospora phragmitis TaxID=2905665 RepID=A0ABR1VD89_9PEZI